MRENLELVKKEQLNPEFLENAEKLEDWLRFDLITVEKTSTIIDFLVFDLNHDGIPDIVLAVKHKDGSCSIKELIYSSTSTLAYASQEIWFGSSVIVQLLGVYDLELSTYSILYLTAKGELSYMLNKDPLYSSEIMVNLNYNQTLSSFVSCDLDRDGKKDFIIAYNGTVVWVNKEDTKWVSKNIYKGSVLQVIMTSVTSETSNSLFLLYSDRLVWTIEVPAKAGTEGFTWNAKEEVMTLHEFNIELEQSFSWDKFKITVISK